VCSRAPVSVMIQKFHPLPIGETVGLSSRTTALRAPLGVVKLRPARGPLVMVTTWVAGSKVASTWVSA
jgi:hypothetical protein